MNDTVVYLVRNSDDVAKANLNFIKNSDNELGINNILSVSGEKNAEKLSKLDEFKNIDAIYSSSYVNALSTAKYFALENNTIINVDDRLNDLKVGKMEDLDWKDFRRLQSKSFDFKLSGGESVNQVKKRAVDSLKNILMYETGNRILIVSHSFPLTYLLSSWCCVGKNYDDQIILSYNDETLVDGEWGSSLIFKVTFDGMNVTNIERLEY